MERHELEDRIRASLQARAEDVEPTPTLWRRVSARVSRRTWWHVGAWTLSGAVAVVALVVGVAAVLDTPRSIQIDSVGTETSTPTEADSTPTEPAAPTPGGGGGGMTPVVVADGNGVHEVDPATGEVVADLPVFEGLAEGGPVGDVAVRPGSGPDELVVATMIGIEGTSWEIQLTTFGPDRQLQASHRIHVYDDAGNSLSAGGPFTPDSEAFPPTMAWSADGEYLAWGRQQAGDVTVYAVNWEDLQVEPDQVVPTTVAELPGDGTLQPARVQDWVGDPEADSQLLLSTTDGIEQLAVCLPTGLCGDDARGQMVLEGGTVIDVDHLANGSRVVLVVRTGAERDAENATLELVANPMDDNQRTLPVPDGVFPEGTAGPTDGWLSAGGDTVAVGFGRPGGGALLTVSGELAEDLAVSANASLPGGVTAVGVAGPVVSFGEGEGTAPERTENPDAVVDLAHGSLDTSPAGRAVDVGTVQVTGGVPAPAVDRANDLLDDRARAIVDAYDRKLADAPPGEQPPELRAEVVVDRQGPQVLSVAWAISTYLGGANADSSWQTLTIDLTTGAPITFDDLFVDGAHDQLVDPVADAVVARVEGNLDLATVAEALRSSPSVLEAVTVTRRDVVFHFDQYEVAPGAAGRIDATVPAARLADLLTRQGQAIFEV